MVKKDEKREELLDAAFEVLLKYGPRKATMEDFASKADMATTSLYYYFKNKKEIIQATAKREIQRTMDDIQEALEKGGSIEERLGRMWLAAFAPLIKQNMDIDDFLEIIQYTKDLIPKLLNYENAKIRELLEEGTASGELQIENMDLAVLTVASAMRGIAQALIQGENPELIIQVTHKLARLLLRGMQAADDQQ
ncbi:MAG: TetR/AcrR family transcriptional regulator [Deltaproteobacteria bacterium]|nr:TetR/AcrR family transcriptional regulator [Deltaproteobacteria bacterium]